MKQTPTTTGHQMELPMDNHVAVVDVGTGKIKMVVGEVVEGKLTGILAARDVPNRGVTDGAYNIHAIVKGLQELVEDTHSICGITPASVAVCFSDPRVAMHHNPAMVAVEEEIVQPHHVNRVLSIAAQAFPGRKDNYILHVVPQSFSVDFGAKTLEPVGFHGVRLDVESMLVTVPPRRVDLLKRAFKEAGLGVTRFVYAPFGAMNAVLSRRERRLGALVIDIGRTTTDVLFVQDETVRSVLTFNGGGNLLTSDIADILQCLEEEADDLKEKHGAAAPMYLTEPNKVIEVEGSFTTTTGKVAAIIQARLEEMFASIRYTLESDGIVLPKNGTVVLTGGTSQLKGIDRLAASVFETGKVRVGMPAVPGTAFENTRNPAYSSAMGLLEYMAARIGERGVARPATPPPPPPQAQKKSQSQEPKKKTRIFDSRKFRTLFVE